jgi:preprotein translocase subunit SecG
MFWTNALIDLLLFIFVVDCVLMCLVILMQRSKQEGLGAAFGGGLTESVWGAQTSNVLVKGTVWMAVIFFVLSISLARLYTMRATEMEKISPVQEELMKTPAPAVTNAPPASALSTPAAPATSPIVPASTPTPVAPAPVTPTPVAPNQPAAK